jgi:hypothetical protein
VRQVRRIVVDLLAVLIIGYFFYLTAWFMAASVHDLAGNFFPTLEQKKRTALTLVGMLFPTAFSIIWGIFRICNTLKVRQRPFGENFRTNIPLRFMLATGGAATLYIFLHILAAVIHARGN